MGETQPAGNNLMDINVDGLFENHSISEIDQIHHKLQKCIEDKKEDLRIMVGERYRDLLQAADTIGEMRKTSTDVIGHIDGILNGYRSLNEQQLIGFKVDTKTDSTNRTNDKTSNKHFSTMAQVHLLLALPELIWQRVDDMDYFQATQLFIFARHIYTGLQLDANLEIAKTFPIAKRQWEHLNQFFFMIKRMCLKQLGRADLSTDLVVKCLTSLALLDNCQIDKLLTLFFQLRTHAFQEMLATNADSFKTRILNSLRLLNETVWQVYKCFVDASSESNKCLLIDELELIGGPDAKPVIAMIPLDESQVYKSLPALISNFKPQIQMQSMDANSIQRSLDSWIRTISSESAALLRNVFDSIGSVRTIHNINKAAIELEKPDNWKVILQRLHLSTGMDFYRVFYQTLIEERIKTIILVSWTDAIEKSVNSIAEILGTDSTASANEKSFWVENSDDNPSYLNRDNNRNHVLLMKAKGYNTAICQICQDLDDSIKLIYDDLNLYVNSTVNNHLELHDDPSKPAKHAKLVAFLRESSQNAITDFIVRVKTLTTQDDIQSESIVFLAKLLKAITEICPHVKQCLMPTSLLLSNTWNESNISNIEHWEQMCRQLNDESIDFWRQWLESFLNECLYTKDGQCFSTDLTLIAMLDLFPNWEQFSIEEKDESNATLQSIIRVPAHPSIPLQRFLFDCCTKLNRRIPETLPKPVTQILNTNLLEHILHTYKTLCENNAFILTNQNASLQLYFDIKFVMVLLSSGMQNDKFQEIAAKFKAAIDPFDFELFHKYINANVKLAAQRLLHQYGLLVVSTWSSQTFLATSIKQIKLSGVQDKDPNLLPLANGGAAHTNWFTMLPIPDEMKHAKIIAEAKIEKAKPSPSKGSPAPLQSTTQQNLSNVKSNAAAFFGAMSQDWFR